MADQHPVQPTPDLPPAIGPGPSPFWPQHLVDLVLRPTRFFTEQLGLGRTPYVVIVTWTLGMSSVVDRIDTRIVQAELHGDPERMQVIASVLSTWPQFWAIVLAGGLLGGVFYWWIGGWWCRVRVGWSGAEDPDPRLARLLLVYSSFVFAGPAVLAVLAQTFLYPNYLAAYQSEFMFSIVVLVMIFWSLVTTYKGAVALFPVSRGRARLWFIALPAAFYFLIMGGAGLLASQAAP